MRAALPCTSVLAACVLLLIAGCQPDVTSAPAAGGTTRGAALTTAEAGSTAGGAARIVEGDRDPELLQAIGAWRKRCAEAPYSTSRCPKDAAREAEIVLKARPLDAMHTLARLYAEGGADDAARAAWLMEHEQATILKAMQAAPDGLGAPTRALLVQAVSRGYGRQPVVMHRAPLTLAIEALHLSGEPTRARGLVSKLDAQVGESPALLWLAREGMLALASAKGSPHLAFLQERAEAPNAAIARAAYEALARVPAKEVCPWLIERADEKHPHAAAAVRAVASNPACGGDLMRPLELARARVQAHTTTSDWVGVLRELQQRAQAAGAATTAGEASALLLTIARDAKLDASTRGGAMLAYALGDTPDAEQELGALVKALKDDEGLAAQARAALGVATKRREARTSKP